MKVDIYNTEKKYNVIYADPPWHYNTWRNGMGTAEKHYPTMKIEKILAMKDTIQKISENDCVLFLWVTFPCLFKALPAPAIFGHAEHYKYYRTQWKNIIGYNEIFQIHDVRSCSKRLYS